MQSFFTTLVVAHLSDNVRNMMVMEKIEIKSNAPLRLVYIHIYQHFLYSLQSQIINISCNQSYNAIYISLYKQYNFFIKNMIKSMLPSPQQNKTMQFNIKTTVNSFKIHLIYAILICNIDFRAGRVSERERDDGEGSNEKRLIVNSTF